MAMAKRSATVYDTGWTTVTLKDKSTELKREVWEFQAPVTYRVYSKDLGGSKSARMEANVRLVHNTFRRPVDDSSAATDACEFELQPWIDVDEDGRCDLRIHLHGVARNVYLHDAAWYYFYNDGKFPSFAAFQKELQKADGSRVDHCGGNPARLCVQKLRLEDARKSASAGGQQRQFYKRSGVRVRTSALLKDKPVRLPQPRVKRSLAKRPATRVKRPAAAAGASAAARVRRPAAAFRARRPAAAPRAAAS
jgi:hypothetical protein